MRPGCLFAIAVALVACPQTEPAASSDSNLDSFVKESAYAPSGYLLQKDIEGSGKDWKMTCGCNRGLLPDQTDDFSTCWTNAHCVHEFLFEDPAVIPLNYAVGYGDAVRTSRWKAGDSSAYYDVAGLPVVERILTHPHWKKKGDAPTAHDLALIRYRTPTQEKFQVRAATIADLPADKALRLVAQGTPDPGVRRSAAVSFVPWDENIEGGVMRINPSDRASYADWSDARTLKNFRFSNDVATTDQGDGGGGVFHDQGAGACKTSPYQLTALHVGKTVGKPQGVSLQSETYFLRCALARIHAPVNLAAPFADIACHAAEPLIWSWSLSEAFRQVGPPSNPTDLRDWRPNGGLLRPSEKVTYQELLPLYLAAFRLPHSSKATDQERLNEELSALRLKLPTDHSSWPVSAKPKRLEFFLSLAGLLGIAGTEVSPEEAASILRRFADADDIATFSRPAMGFRRLGVTTASNLAERIAVLVKRGVMYTYPNTRRLAVDEWLTRGEAVAFLALALADRTRVNPPNSDPVEVALNDEARQSPYVIRP